MTTTLELDDALLTRAQAQFGGLDPAEIVDLALRQLLDQNPVATPAQAAEPPPPDSLTGGIQLVYPEDGGLPYIPSRGVVITSEMIRQICDEEGI